MPDAFGRSRISIRLQPFLLALRNYTEPVDVNKLPYDREARFAEANGWLRVTHTRNGTTVVLNEEGRAVADALAEFSPPYGTTMLWDSQLREMRTIYGAERPLTLPMKFVLREMYHADGPFDALGFAGALRLSETEIERALRRFVEGGIAEVVDKLQATPSAIEVPLYAITEKGRTYVERDFDLRIPGLGLL